MTTTQWMLVLVVALIVMLIGAWLGLSFYFTNLA